MRKLGISALLAVLAAALVGACSLDTPLTPGSGTVPIAHPENGRPILFVGNSLTYVNDLPGILQAMADSAGGKKLAVATVAFPDYALEDHWAEGSALQAIKGGGWRRASSINRRFIPSGGRDVRQALCEVTRRPPGSSASPQRRHCFCR